ncbi:MAG: 3D domain-containing protein [Butyricicoccaceae bacterium]
MNKLKRKIRGLTRRNRFMPAAALMLTTAFSLPAVAAGNLSAEPAAVTTMSEHEMMDSFHLNSSFEVTVKADGRTRTITSENTTVGQFLENAGIELSATDEITPSVDSILMEPTEITIVRVEIKQVTETTAIDFKTTYKNDSSLASGKTKTLTEGVKGERETVYEVTYRDGKEVERVEKSSRVVKEPTDAVIAKGTKISVPTGGSAPVSASRVITMEATAYSGGGTTASGMAAAVGRVAVDPRVIPLGTRLYISGYGYCVAADTGGAIKGNRVDLYFNSNSQCIQFGRRQVKVYVLS